MRNDGIHPLSALPEPFEIVNPKGKASLLLICDHASNRVPPELADLGLGPTELGAHIAWDIGAAAVSRALAARFDAPALLAGVSRLVIDCNRRPGDPTAIPEISDGVVIPGNQGLDRAAIAAREEAWFDPYHAALAEGLDHCDRRGRLSGLLSIHSFTPVMNGQARPWQIGVLWTHDPRMAEPLLASLHRHGIPAGDNQPYSGRAPNGGYVIQRYGAAHDRPHVALEIRQDEIGDEAGVARWSKILGDILTPILRELGLIHEGSRKPARKAS